METITNKPECTMLSTAVTAAGPARAAAVPSITRPHCRYDTQQQSKIKPKQAGAMVRFGCHPSLLTARGLRYILLLLCVKAQANENWLSLVNEFNSLLLHLKQLLPFFRSCLLSLPLCLSVSNPQGGCGTRQCYGSGTNANMICGGIPKHTVYVWTKLLTRSFGRTPQTSETRWVFYPDVLGINTQTCFFNLGCQLVLPP